MKRLSIKIVALLCLSASSHLANAYTIGGMYVTLIDCHYGSFGYQYGNIGTYRGTDGNLYNVFFGRQWCAY